MRLAFAIRKFPNNCDPRPACFGLKHAPRLQPWRWESDGFSYRFTPFASQSYVQSLIFHWDPSSSEIDFLRWQTPVVDFVYNLVNHTAQFYLEVVDPGPTPAWSPELAIGLILDGNDEGHAKEAPAGAENPLTSSDYQMLSPLTPLTFSWDDGFPVSVWDVTLLPIDPRP